MYCCAGALFVAKRCSDMTSLDHSMDTDVLNGIWAMAAISKSLPHLQKLSIISCWEGACLAIVHPRGLRLAREGDDLRFSLHQIDALGLQIGYIVCIALVPQ